MSLYTLVQYESKPSALYKYILRTSNFGIVGGGLGVLGKGFASMELA